MDNHSNNKIFFEEFFQYMENGREFKAELHDISKTWDQLILLSQLGSTGIDMSQTKTNFNDLTEELITHLCDATLNKVVNEMSSKAQVAVDIVIRNLFERTADIGFLSSDDDIRKYLLTLPSLKDKIIEHKDDVDDTEFRIAKKEYIQNSESIIQRFKEYVSKYSVYYDIILFNSSGEVVSKLDDSNKITQSYDDVLQMAKVTSEDYIETYKYHDFLPTRERSLVYTYKIFESNESKEVIGYLSLCFKFQDEMKGIFDRLVYKNNKETILLLDKEGFVISSSDPYHIPIASHQETQLDKSFGRTQFAGRDYIIKTCETNGYEGFFGLGWMGHIMIPIDSAFKSYTKELDLEDNILFSIMENEELFKKELLSIPSKAAFIQNELNRSVWNGNISQSDDETSNTDFTRSILREVKETGEKTKNTFNISIEKLNQTIITSLIDNATSLASLSIDIMDRNLYERANDVRWWALISKFKEVLEKNDSTNQKDKKEIDYILKYINGLYTVYTNIFVYDINGNILAVSNDEEKNLVDSRLTQSWVKETFLLKDSSKYVVSAFENTQLYKNESTYIYNAAIWDTKNQNIVGGIGIVFDSTQQFKSILIESLPHVDNEIQKGVFSVFVEKKTKNIISCTDDKLNIGDKLSIDEMFFKLSNGDSLSKIQEFNGKYYMIGAECSSGYREYKNQGDDYTNDVISFVFIEAGDINETINSKSLPTNNSYNYHIQKHDTVEEIATFYIKDKWLGVKKNEILEALSINSLVSSISLDSKHHFKGTISYKDHLVSVLDISPFIRTQINDEGKHDIVIVNYNGSTGEHTIGIVVDRLGEIIRVPTQNIKVLEKHLIGGGILEESIVQPPSDNDAKTLLTLLNITEIDNLKQ